ncbi:hypothetical protein [uncultured Pseudoteredinibacter sp.]|uniref:hypothetical protein n=1 Tax=uncultured Pseudoteredinibacter sp. TaxID=1641701 RepID=UPI002636E40E|nr:hypothetical protein [uncultured Pseudoteredinibacter sp.]
MKKLYVALPLILLLSACANNIQDRSGFGTTPASNVGYIAGGFLNSYRESFARMALEIHNTSTNESFFIELQQPKNHSDIEIFPFSEGSYRLSNLVEMGGIGDVGKRVPIKDPDLSQPFLVKTGAITYIGHFDGRSTNEINSIFVVGTSGWVDTNSGYGFTVVNEEAAKVSEQIAKIYRAYSSLNVSRAFSLDTASQRDKR